MIGPNPRIRAEREATAIAMKREADVRDRRSG